jgi:hypothetical protein
MPSIKFPDMRMNVLSNLHSLSNEQHQRRCWVRHEAYDCFDEVIHALFDDSGFDRGPNSSIGVLLFDEREADHIRAAMDLIDTLFAKYGKELSDADYMSKPEWRGIVAGAKDALEVMKRNDLRYMEPAERRELYDRYRINGWKEPQ